MRAAVIGGTGLVGRHTVRALHHAGHEAVVVSRSHGVDVTTGDGLDEALAGADAVIDVTNTDAMEAAEAEAFFETATRNVMAAGQRAGVGHHVVLSITNIDRIDGNAHYAGKLRQEAVALAGPVPATILRAAQFHDFAAMAVGWTRRGDEAPIAPLLLQPVAVEDVAAVLVELAAGTPQGRAPDLAGPEPQDMVDMARRTLAARGESIRLIPTWRSGLFGPEMAGEVMLPGPGARLGPTTFDAWLAAGAGDRDSADG